MLQVSLSYPENIADGLQVSQLHRKSLSHRITHTDGEDWTSEQPLPEFAPRPWLADSKDKQTTKIGPPVGKRLRVQIK